MMISSSLTPHPESLDRTLQFLSSLLLDELRYRDLEMKKVTFLLFLLSLVREDLLLYWRMMHLRLLQIKQTLKSNPPKKILFLSEEFLRNLRNSFLPFLNLLDLLVTTPALTPNLSQLSHPFLLDLINDPPLLPVQLILNQSIITLI